MIDTMKQADNPLAERRLMLMVTSNAYKDRDKDIIKQSALEAWADSQWKDGAFIGTNPLLVWHGGDPIGKQLFAMTYRKFLIEVFEELPDQAVNLALDGEEPVILSVKQVWDALDQLDDLACSHKFIYVKPDGEDNVYEAILKVESTVLPRSAAANVLTDARILRRAA